MTTLLAENVSAVLRLLRRRKICFDLAFNGELRRLAESPSVHKSYFAARGASVDEIGEILWDAGFVHDRLRPAEVVEILDDLLGTPPRAREYTPSVTMRILELMSDGQRRTRRDIRNALNLPADSDILRSLRRLREKPYGLRVLPLKVGRHCYFRLTEKDLIHAAEFLDRERDML